MITKIIDYIIDTFWIATAIWMVLYAWIWTGIPCPLIIKDIFYALSGIMDYWFLLNGVLGTIRFIRRHR